MPALKEEFGYTLASPEVVILDPCTGTGNFIVNIIERMPGRALQEAYENRLFANEVMLLGSRSALEWVIDQYQVKGESDPNREDDPGYIVRLVG